MSILGPIQLPLKAGHPFPPSHGTNSAKSLLPRVIAAKLFPDHCIWLIPAPQSQGSLEKSDTGLGGKTRELGNFST